MYDLPAVALQYFTVYGPRIGPNMSISNFVAEYINGDPPVVYGDGTQTWDFTFIADVIEANSRLLETDAADGEAVNVWSTDNIQIWTLAEEIRDWFAPDLYLEFAERYDADPRHADTEKAEELLDYDPDYTIRDVVERFIELCRENREWYEPLMLAS